MNEMLSGLLDRVSVEVARADNKASILVAGLLAALGGLGAGLGASGWQPWHHGPWCAAFLWVSFGLSVSAIFCLGTVLYPKRHHASAADRPIAYYGDVVRFDNALKLGEALSGAHFTERDVLVDQLWEISHLVNQKFRYGFVVLRTCYKI